MKRILLLLVLVAAPVLGAQESRATGEIGRTRNADDVRALPEDTESLHVYQADDAALKVLPRLKKLRHLRVVARHSVLSHKGYAALGELSSLTRLEMEDCASLDDDALKSIARLKALTLLSLEAPGKISARGIEHLGALSELVELRLTGCVTLDDAALRSLARLTGLRRLTLDDCPQLTDSGFVFLAPLKGLEVLSVQSVPGFHGAALGKLSVDNLKELHANFCFFCEQGVRALGRCFQLETLGFATANASVEAVRELAKCAFLKNLRVLLPGDDAAYYDVIAALPRLEKLELAFDVIDDSCTRNFAKLVNLRELDLQETKIGDRTLEILAALPRLEILNIAGCKATAAGLALLARASKLRRLNVSDTALDDKACAALAKITSLQSLSLQNTKITFAGVEALSRLEGLKELDLGGCARVSDACLAALSGVKTLTYLNLKGCKLLTPEKVADLRKALPLCLILH